MSTVLQSEIAARHKEIAEICTHLGVRRLYLFGSGTRSASPRDLDFLVDFGERPVEEHVRAYFALLEKLQALFALPVDVVTPSGLANPYVRQRVEQEKALLYAA
jgi:predicted nucleotidyltransferase